MKKLVYCLILTSACGDEDGPASASTSPTATGSSPSSTGSPGSDPDPTTTGSSSGLATAGATTSEPTTSEPTTISTSGDELTTTMEVSSSSADTGPACLAATAPCADTTLCCAGLECGTTTLGQVCCGLEGASCATANGEDCCGDLLCVDGTTCGYGNEPGDCAAPCTAPPALDIEKQRLAVIGGSFLGICGDVNHTYGYHLPAAALPADDYSLQGAANVPVCQWHAAAIDIGMDWPVSRDWLMWLIPRIASDEIQGIAEVIGSYDGVNVRYWSDSSGWSADGVPYQGEGHDTWTHVAIYRSTALEDHGILAGWTANGGP